VPETKGRQLELGFERLCDVLVPSKYFNRIRTGVAALDRAFGGEDMPGILPGSVTLLTGVPGAGKSTLGLQLAEVLQANAGRHVLYNVGEENRPMLKLRADRLGLRAQFWVKQYETVGELIEACKRTGVEVLIQDSLQSFHEEEVRGHHLRGGRLLTYAVKQLTRLAQDEGITVVIVGQSTKKGEFAGPQELKHQVDAHAHIRLDLDTGERVLNFEKNRNGPAAVPVMMLMDSKGLHFGPPPEGREVAAERPSARQLDRRERCVQVAKARLLDGDRLSGYCHERLDLDVSGNFWRGILEAACRELEREGFEIRETTIDRRSYRFVSKRPEARLDA
jgi:RecA/RadA recombinase